VFPSLLQPPSPSQYPTLHTPYVILSYYSTAPLTPQPQARALCTGLDVWPKG